MQKLNGYREEGLVRQTIGRDTSLGRGVPTHTGLFFSVEFAVRTGIALALIMTWAIAGAVGIRQMLKTR